MRMHPAPATRLKPRLSAVALFCVIFSELAMRPAGAQTAPAATDPNFGQANYPNGWKQCTSSNAVCWFPQQLKDVIFGNNGKYSILQSVKDMVPCIARASDAFDDPKSGGNNFCWVSNDLPKRSRWKGCAYEGQRCVVSGTKSVMYGIDGRYVTKQVTGGVVCSASGMGQDPFPGHNNKACWVSP